MSLGIRLSIGRSMVSRNLEVVSVERLPVVSIVLGCFCVLLSVLPAQAETVTDEELHFTLDVPEGFTPRPDLVGAMPNIVHAFQLGEAKEGEIPVLLLIEKLGGTIDRKPITREHLPAGFVGEMFDTTWQGFDVQATAVHESVNGLKAITYNVLIPLKRKAIQVRLLIPAEREPEFRPMLRPILDGLHGESNWVASAATPAVASSPLYPTLLLIMAIGIVLGGLVILWFLSRITPMGTVLVISVMLYAISWRIGEEEGREMLVVGGAIRMLGFAGGILGAIDMFLKRKPKDEKPSEPTPE
ncbi:hypothetical protein GC197_14590 [bacterium]|nr:hypothetical protein [bacterium]